MFINFIEITGGGGGGEAYSALNETFVEVIDRSVETLTIPDGTETIGENAFASCTELTEVIIPSGVTSIENGAFKFNPSLERIVFEGETPPTVAASAFTEISRECEIVVPEGAEAAYSSVTETIEEAADSPAVILTDEAGVSQYNKFENNTIPANYYSGNTDLYDVVVESGITVGEAAFRNSSVKSAQVLVNASSWAKNTFSACTQLESLTIGNPNVQNNLVNPNNDFAKGCTALTSLTFYNIGRFEGQSFSGCISLSTVYGYKYETGPSVYSTNSIMGWPSGGTFYYPEGANYDSMKNKLSGWTFVEVETGNLVRCTTDSGTTISFNPTNGVCPNNKFSGNTTIVKAHIFSGITAIAQNAFSGCTNLNFLQFDAITPPITSGNTFAGVSQTGTVLVPTAGLSNYSTSILHLPTGWTITDEVFLIHQAESVNEIIDAGCFIYQSGATQNDINTMFDDGQNLWVTDWGLESVYNNTPIGQFHYKVEYDANSASHVALIEYETSQPLSAEAQAAIADYVAITGTMSNGDFYATFNFNQNHTLDNSLGWETNPLVGGDGSLTNIFVPD